MFGYRLALASLVVLALAGCGGGGLNTAPPARVFGTGEAGLVDGTAEAARFSNPVNVEVAVDGTVFVADFDNDAIRKISPSGTVTTLLKTQGFSRPFGLTLAPASVLYVQTDGNDQGERDETTGTIWRVNPVTGQASVVARNLGRPRGLQALDDGRLVMSDPAHHTIRILNPANGQITLLAGSPDQPGFANGSGSEARFNAPYGLIQLSDSSLLVADRDNHRLRRVTLQGQVTTFAGAGTPGNENGPLATATFNRPTDVAVSGNLVFVADHDNFTIRRIRQGRVEVQAGNGQPGFEDANGPTASFFGLEGIALRDGTNLWIADGNNGEPEPYNRVRRINLRGG